MLLISLLSASLLLPITTNEQIAAQAWEHRDTQTSLETALRNWEQIVVQAPQRSDILTHLAHGYYLLADGFYRMQGNTNMAMSMHQKGYEAAEKAMRSYAPEFATRIDRGDAYEKAVTVIDKGGEGAIFWYASNLGRYASIKGLTTALRYKSRIFGMMEHAMHLDPTYYHAGPHRYFGVFYAKAPGFAGGDMQKSKEHFDIAMRLDPHYFATRVLYAEEYATRIDDPKLFEDLLKKVQQENPAILTDVTPEQKIEQEKAKRLLAQKEDLF